MKTRRGVSGCDVTTLAIGGELKQFTEPNSVEELSETLQNGGKGARVLGAGSNLLVPDSGVEDLVIRLGKGFRYSKILSEEKDAVLLEVGGSMPLMSLSRAMCEQGFSGLEFAGGIPASIGGAVWMNAGAHHSEMSNVIQAVNLVLESGEVRRLKREEISFSYRHSGFPEGSIVVSAEIELMRGNPAEIQGRRAEFLAERKKRQPLTVPSAGSIFRNPRADLTAGMVLERAGCKGLKIGGAQVSEMHANWIVNPDRLAKAGDVTALMQECVARAERQESVKLVSELVRW